LEEKIVMILRRYMPPLSQENVDAISEEIVGEWRKAEKQFKAEQKTRAAAALHEKLK